MAEEKIKKNMENSEEDVVVEPEPDSDRGGQDISETIQKLKKDLKTALEERQKYHILENVKHCERSFVLSEY